MINDKIAENKQTSLTDVIVTSLSVKFELFLEDLAHVDFGLLDEVTSLLTSDEVDFDGMCNFDFEKLKLDVLKLRFCKTKYKTLIQLLNRQAIEIGRRTYKCCPPCKY